MRRIALFLNAFNGAALACFGLALLLPGCSAREPSLVPAEVVTDSTLPAREAGDLYVSPHGSDSNPGTESEPFKTIRRAAEAAAPGTTVHVAPGVYPGGFRTNVSGSAAARILFQSTERWGAKLVPSPDSNSSMAWDNRGNYVDIVGFEVDGSEHQGGTRWSIGLYSAGSFDGLRQNHVHHIATNLPCTSAGGAGIGVDSYYHGIKSEVISNTVHDIGPAGCQFVHGIYVSMPASVKNNIVYRVSAAGIHLWHDAREVIIANNTVTAASIGIVVGGGDYYYTKGPNDHTHVHNNIVFDNKQGILEQGSTGKHNTYRNNLVFQNSGSDWRLLNGVSHAGTVSAAPQFVAYSRSATPDFRLSPKSPAIGKGMELYADATDFSGKPRTSNTGYDIGAFQH
jgi:hypothetical protein